MRVFVSAFWMGEWSFGMYDPNGGGHPRDSGGHSPDVDAATRPGSCTKDLVGKLQTVCLENHSWDWDADAVVPGLIIRRGVYVIANARHDVAGQRTLLNLVRAPDCVEIDL